MRTVFTKSRIWCWSNRTEKFDQTSMHYVPPIIKLGFLCNCSDRSLARGGKTKVIILSVCYALIDVAQTNAIAYSWHFINLVFDVRWNLWKRTNIKSVQRKFYTFSACHTRTIVRMLNCSQTIKGKINNNRYGKLAAYEFLSCTDRKTAFQHSCFSF